MEETTTPKRQVMHLRIPSTTHTAVAELAQRSHRSLNGATVYLIERGLEAEAQGQNR